MPQQENKTTQRTYTRAEVDSIVEKAIEAERARVAVVPSDEKLWQLFKITETVGEPCIQGLPAQFKKGYKAALQSQRTISEGVLREALKSYDQALRQWNFYRIEFDHEEKDLEAEQYELCKKALKALRDAVGGE